MRTAERGSHWESCISVLQKVSKLSWTQKSWHLEAPHNAHLKCLHHLFWLLLTCIMLAISRGIWFVSADCQADLYLIRSKLGVVHHQFRHSVLCTAFWSAFRSMSSADSFLVRQLSQVVASYLSAVIAETSHKHYPDDLMSDVVTQSFGR